MSCTSLTSVIIPSSVTSIGTEAFFNCTNLSSITIPNSVTNIDSYAFRSSGLTSIEIPGSVPRIRNYTFDCCSKLKSVKICNGVTSIGNHAFDNCEALNSVSIPNSMTTIGDFAFSWCMNINSLRVDIDTPISISDNVFIFYNATLYVPEGSKALYQAAQPWSRFEAIEEYPVKKCATPTISYANGKVCFACETEGVKFVPTAKCLPKQTQNGNELELGGTYDISVVATKEGYRDSQVAKKTIEINQMGDMDGDGEVNVTDVTSLVNVVLKK